MNLFYRKRVAKSFAIVVLFSIITNLLIPASAYALTSGPSQPEFSSFEPVATTNMVNEFSGDFTYNLPVLEVPGPQGSGYALSLSYHSGTSPEEEASWVGHGWTLNPGSINRNTRGFPDDYKGQEVIYHNKVPKNWTVTAGGSAAFEMFSIDGLLPSATMGIRYNNYRGFGYNAGVGLELGKGAVNLGFNVSDNEGSFSLDLNPAAAMDGFKETRLTQYDIAHTSNGKKQLANDTKKNEGLKKVLSKLPTNMFGSNYGIFSFSEMQRPTNFTPYTGITQNVTFGLIPTGTPIQMGVSVNMFGSYSYQWNAPTKNHKAFGYMYSDASTDDTEMLDYYVEKETTYNKRDVFLGVPFNNADNYVVSGEGMGGGFRMYNKKIGQFRPNKVTSRNLIFNVGAELELGVNIGGGVDLGTGFTQMVISDWKSRLSLFSKEPDEKIDEDKYFRFNNDLGGSIEHPTGDAPVRARLKLKMPAPAGHKEYEPEIPHIKWNYSDEERNGRSSYISYHTNSEIYNSRQRGYNTYTINPDVDNLIGYKNSSGTVNANVEGLIKDGIGEIVTFNEEGSRYIYGLPVYSIHERNLQYGATGTGENNYLIYGKNDNIKVGEERLKPYANSFLLTDITTPDFIDRTLNGPSDDDFGGYTKFNYQRHKGGITNGSSEDWYQWRTPYNGWMYHKNSLSDPKDDMASATEGQKEIYYLQSIETKSHVAIFKTSTTLRNDAVEAPAEANAGSKAAKGTDQLKKLEAIELYIISDVTKTGGIWTANAGAKPIKTVQLRYDEELCKGAPNATSGKLTLKQLWFTYEGINEAKVSPYVFGYNYPNFNSTTSPQTKYPSKYSSLTTGFDGLAQNPNYSIYNLDAWGNYQSNETSAARYAKMQSWPDQTPVATFDPAAYQLKVIKLPSGGEIHVQYEQDDYSYVQDQYAHVLANITKQEGNRYYLNTREAGINANSSATELKHLENLKLLIDKKYVTGKEKMYFKFLYKLLAEGNGPSIESCNSEYITGYVDILRAEIDKIDPANPKLYIELFADEKRLPEKVCKDFVKTQRLGNLALGDCNPSTAGLSDIPDPVQLAKQLLAMTKTIVVPGTLCREKNLELSYLKIPTPVSKKGGGVRVKRLLMFDAGDGTGNDAVLYGNEYDYNKIDEETGTIRSSGVATNEPSGMRDENALVGFIARKHQSLVSKIIAGKDKKQSEGPLGESILPGPSVGYSRVTVKNIHNGITNPGFTVKEFFTAKDYPVELKLDKVATDLQTERDYLPLPLGVVNKFINNIWAVQGFSFVQNGMHGQIKRVASYGGDYNDIYTLNKAVASSQQMYTYVEPGASVKLMDKYGSVVNGFPGKEVDLTFAQSMVEDHMLDVKVEGDIDVGFFGWFPIPFATAMPSFTNNKAAIFTHVTSKVIKYPALVSKIISVEDGVTHYTENLAYDKYTGTPVAVRSWDDHAGSFLTQDIPASWEYANMGQKSINEGKIIEGIAFDNTNNEIGFNSTNTCALLNTFTRGDLLAIGTKFFHVSHIDYVNDKVKVEPSFVNSTGDIGSISFLTILKSGRTNALNNKSGQITTHSTLNNIDINTVDQAARYDATDPLAVGLNSQLANKSGTGSITLTGPYTINVSNFSSCIPSSCSINGESASVKNIVFEYNISASSTSLNMISFTLTCNGADVIINCL